jgi:hypothetical protein
MRRTKRSVTSDKELMFSKQSNVLKSTALSDLTQCTRIQVCSVSEEHAASIFSVEE